MSTPESKTQLRQYDGPPLDISRPIYTLFGKMPPSMQYAWESITGGIKFKLGEFASLMQNEQTANIQKKDNEELGLRAMAPTYPYNNKITGDKVKLRRYTPENTTTT